MYCYTDKIINKNVNCYVYFSCGDINKNINKQFFSSMVHSNAVNLFMKLYILNECVCRRMESFFVNAIVSFFVIDQLVL